jgi:HSP20 family protein
MTALTRIDTFDRLLPEMFRRFARPFPFEDGSAGEIRIDLTENDKDYQVRAEMPGVKKEDIRVNVEGNFVSIAAQSRTEKEEKSGGRAVLKETYVGRSSRGFSLAHEIDAQRVTAKLEDGILKLTLPKREGGGSRTIAIQ